MMQIISPISTEATARGSQNDENQEKAKWTKVTYTIGIYSNAWPPEVNSALSHYQYESEHYVTY